MQNQLALNQVSVKEVLKVLNNAMFNLNDEKATQVQIENCLIRAKIAYEREKNLSKQDKPDFLIGEIVIEVKIKGQQRAIYDQCARYCGHDRVKSLILMTNRAMGFPEEINGKACYVIEMGKAWL